MTVTLLLVFQSGSHFERWEVKGAGQTVCAFSGIIGVKTAFYPLDGETYDAEIENRDYFLDMASRVSFLPSSTPG